MVLPADWPSAAYQRVVNVHGVPSEEIIRIQLQERRPVERPGDALLARARQVAAELDRETTAATMADGKQGG